MDTVELKPENVGCMEPLEEMISCSQPLLAERRPKPHPEEALNCPRCSSTNTKFCYYNNYSLSQPRYFCKTCRRYWTKGGTLRNVPVGGGYRKNRRPCCTKQENKPISNGITQPNSDVGTHHSLSSYGQDMILPFPIIQQYCGYSNGSEADFFENKPSPMPWISSDFNGGFQDVEIQNSSPFLYHSMDGFNGYFNQQRIEEGGERVLFPSEDQREATKPNMFMGFDQKVVNHSTQNSSYWNGVVGTWPELPNYVP